jgi:hypothetical protein
LAIYVIATVLLLLLLLWQRLVLLLLQLGLVLLLLLLLLWPLLRLSPAPWLLYSLQQPSTQPAGVLLLQQVPGI